QGKAPKCTKCEERENVWIKQEKCPHTIGQLNPTIVLYGDSHPKGLKINQITAQNQYKADCLIIIEGDCDEWIKLVNIELSNVKKMTTTRLSKNQLKKTNNKIK
ncbi:4658_t:CDS:2, partial [Racocetra persica]